MGLDVLHTQRELQRLVQRKWKQAERQLEAAAEADEQVAKSHQRGRDARGGSQQAWWAWQKAERLFDHAVQAAAAAKRIETALGGGDPQGHLHDRQGAQAQWLAATHNLVGQEWRQVRRLLQGPRTLNHLDWVHTQLRQAGAASPLREVCVRLWSLRDAMSQAHGDQRVHLAQAVVMVQIGCPKQYPEWQSA